jgi:signal transduction histidine kinase
MAEVRRDNPVPNTFATTIAAAMRDQAPSLAAHWLDRLVAVIPVDPNEVFPSESILDHVPVLIHHIADSLAGTQADVAADSFVIMKARELGDLRYEQEASVHQLLREYELLRSILETFIVDQASALQLSPDVSAVFACVRRLNQTVAVLTQTTVDTFVKRYASTIATQQRRLEQFNRMVGHELRQPLAALQVAVNLIPGDGDGAESRPNKAVAVVRRSVDRLVDLTRTITRLSQMMSTDGSQPSTQRVTVATIVREAARQLRDAADARGVSIRVDADLGDVVVDVGQLELLLMNLLSNGIKYSDPAKPDRFVAVEAIGEGDGPNRPCVFWVRDNGLGMGADQLANIFAPFYRGYGDRDRELGNDGLGLGLAIAQECIASLKGRIDVESTPGDGTSFVVMIPRA